MGTAFLFPGQGAQQIGMGADLVRCFPVARQMFDRAEEITRLPLKKLCFEGPEEELSRTDISQPAIFTMSMATLAVMKELVGLEKMPKPLFYAGLSLGEYTALCAAGVVSFEDGLALVAKRGQYMQEAASATPSGMVCLLGADEEVANRVCQAARGEGVLVPANFNAPGQIVVSGSIDACNRAMELAATCGASGAIELKVAGAFHCPLMQPAADKLGQLLNTMTFQAPSAPVLSNVTGRAHEGVDSIRKLLLDQLTCSVRWQQNCEYMLANGVDVMLEIGPGRVLAGLMRKVDRRANVTSLNGREALEKFAGLQAQ